MGRSELGDQLKASPIELRPKRKILHLGPLPMIEIVNIVASPWDPPFPKKRNRPAVRRGGHRPHDFVRLPRLTAPSQQMIEPRGSPGQKENHPELSVISRCVLSHENPPLTTPQPPHPPP